MNDKQANQLGIDATQVLENEAFKQAMSSIKSVIVDQWKECPVRDREGQLLLLQLVKLADKFEAIFVGMVENGKLAKHRIDIDAIRNESKGRGLLRKFTG